jgi:hypothetical protein
MTAQECWPPRSSRGRRVYPVAEDGKAVAVNVSDHLIERLRYFGKVSAGRLKEVVESLA